MEKITYSFEISVDNIAAVEVIETVSDTKQLGKGERSPVKGEGDTHKPEPVRARVTSDVVFQLPTGHPRRDELEGFESDTEEGHDVLVRQAFPQHSLAVECLLVWLRDKCGETAASMTHLLSPRRISSGVNP